MSRVDEGNGREGAGGRRDGYVLAGTPRRGLALATIGFFAGLTTIVFYGAAGPVLEEHLR